MNLFLARWARAVVCALIVAFLPPALGAQARTPQPTRDSATVVFDDDGLRIHSADGRKQLKVRGYVVTEYRALLSDTADAISDGFHVKRSRMIFDANFHPRLAARIMFDVGPPSSTSPMQDAYADIGLAGTWWLRVGKQKTPSSLERYMSISSQLLPDRSVAVNLSGSRDVGVFLTGTALRDRVEMSVGVFNGVPDGSGTQDSDHNDAKDLTYRLWWKPVRKRVGSVEQGMGGALYGSTGIEKSAATSGTRLPIFKTIAGSPFFSYLESGGVRAAGRHSRSGAFAYLHRGRFGSFAEVMGNSQTVSRGATRAAVGTSGWIANAQWTLTGEPSGQEGVVPRTAFDPDRGRWGAWQVGFRASAVRVGDEAFPTFADSTVAARTAREIGVGLNWYLTRVMRVQLAYEHTVFTMGARTGDRAPERLLQFRWQAYF
ncbi:MAG: hypothetical protein FJ202_05920 [Gemmatimonadetes bacterium]|nr:hypothetical protein [Gemmatimonadota bacterium]